MAAMPRGMIMLLAVGLAAALAVSPSATRPLASRAAVSARSIRMRNRPVAVPLAPPPAFHTQQFRAQAVDTSTLVALNDVVLIQADLEAKKTPGGLFLATTADQLGDEVDGKYRIGTVVAVGEGGLREDGSRIPMPYSKGQRVVMPGSSAVGLRIDILIGNNNTRSRGLFAYREHEIVAQHPLA
ncbi:hypothetical protein T492DRAFT_841115 [Pavlovales sp. CCMP2436]|nr:hypothetical protein T492DRAFT_841115 [Pavlovales sp. CCMP2436]